MALTPFFNNVLMVLLLAGGVLIPIGDRHVLRLSGSGRGNNVPERRRRRDIRSGCRPDFGPGFWPECRRDEHCDIISGFIASGVGTSLIVGGIFGAAGVILLGAIGGFIWKIVQPPQNQPSRIQVRLCTETD